MRILRDLSIINLQRPICPNCKKPMAVVKVITSDTFSYYWDCECTLMAEEGDLYDWADYI